MLQLKVRLGSFAGQMIRVGSIEKWRMVRGKTFQRGLIPECCILALIKARLIKKEKLSVAP